MEDRRPLRFVSASDLVRFCDCTETGLTKWCSRWLRKPAEFSVDTFRFDDLADQIDSCASRWLVASTETVEYLTLNWSSPFPQKLFGAMSENSTFYGSQRKTLSNLEEILLQKALKSLIECIIEELTGASDSVKSMKYAEHASPQNISYVGSGILVILVEIFDEQLVVCIDALGFIEPIEKSTGTDLFPAMSALGKNRLHVSLVLGEAVVDVQSLNDLSVGDVLVVDKRLDEKLEIRVNDVAVCDAEIGQQQGQLAVQVDNALYTD